MKISLSALIKILTKCFPNKHLAIYRKPDNQIFVGIMFGEECGDLLYDPIKNVAYCISINWLDALKKEIYEYSFVQDVKKNKEELDKVPLDWSQSQYEREKGDRSIISETWREAVKEGVL